MNPILIVILIFAGVPLMELYFLIQVGAQIGAFSTIFLTIFTAILGGWMVRTQGFSTLNRVRESIDRGEVPAIEMMEGTVLLICGVLLLLPGFVTDAVGFIFLVPPIRRWLLIAGLKGGGVMRPAETTKAPKTTEGNRIIEGEYRREDDT